jgi:hypothetical protein
MQLVDVANNVSSAAAGRRSQDYYADSPGAPSHATCPGFYAESLITESDTPRGWGERSTHDMLVWKTFLMILSVGLFGSAGALVAYDIYLSSQLRRLLHHRATREFGVPRKAFEPIRLHLERAA